MAFRAMRYVSTLPPMANVKLINSDLGIHLNVSRLPIFGFGTLTHEDREIRRRLFWSAYTWDKVDTVFIEACYTTEPRRSSVSLWAGTRPSTLSKTCHQVPSVSAACGPPLPIRNTSKLQSTTPRTMMTGTPTSGMSPTPATSPITPCTRL